MAELTFNPIVVIGAGRSGTNMLRDCLTELDGFGTWPCDEINLIWRHGNADKPTDEFSAADAHPAARRYIRRAFEKLARAQGLRHVVEKTCANSLRVPFVDTVLPEARYVFIVRDGRDVAASAMQRWTASVELGYLLKKLRFVPPSDLPRYGVRFIRNRLHQARSTDKRQKSWGPRFAGIDELVAGRSLAEVCATQWVRATEASIAAFDKVPPGRIARVTYEDFLAAPGVELARLLDELGLPADRAQIAKAVISVRPARASSWSRNMTTEDAATIERVCAPLLSQLGYAAMSARSGRAPGEVKG